MTTIQAISLQEHSDASSAHVTHLRTYDIRPADHVDKISDFFIDPMVESIRARGLESPIKVRAVNPTGTDASRYEIVDGNIRWMCAVELRIKTLPAVVVEMSDVDAYSNAMRRNREKLCIQAFGAAYDSEFLGFLASSIVNHYPKMIPFTVAELDRIVEGGNLDDHCSYLDDGYYLKCLFGALDWWQGVAELLTSGRDGLYADPRFRLQSEAMLSLLNAALSSFTAAWSQTMFFTDTDTPDAALELLKRYRLFTRHVCAWAQEIWPEVNLQQLFDRA